MKLRNKVLIALSLAWLVFLGLTYVGSRYFLIQSFLNLEHDRAERDLSRVDQAIYQYNNSLYTFTADWTHWNDLYDFMKGNSPTFVPNNLNMVAYINSNINLLAFFDLNDKMVVGTSIDSLNRKLTSFPEGIEKYIFPGSRLLNHKDANKDLTGYILTSSGIMLVASCAITDSDKLLKPLGISIVGRNLDQALVNKISEATKVNIKLLLPDDIKKSSRLESYLLDAMKNNNGHYTTPISSEVLEGYTVIKDINNQPIGMFKISLPRAIYLTGLKSINYYLMNFIILGILFSLLIIWLLRELIIKRLEKLDRDVASISAQAIHNRVDASGTDEISTVSTEINHMLDIIQASHDQLEQPGATTYARITENAS